MRAQPEATVFSVSQNDTDLHCECPRCQALARQEGSQGAPVLNLANRVAEAVEKEFPGKAVETLAYQWTRRAPKTMRPRPNVIVRLCSIECCFSHPLATCDSRENRAFRDDLQAWSKVSQRLWIWDYTTDFAHYLMPFPNQRVRRPNIRFFIANHVTGIFEEDTPDTPHSELAALGGYLTAKFLWNPDYDQDRAMNEFLEGYYGKAARPIRQYIDLLHDRVERENIHVHIYDPPTKPYLDYELLRQANALWEEAEKLVAGDADVLRRVQISRMSVDYAIMERARAELQKPAAAITGRPPIAKLAVERFHPFMKTLGNERPDALAGRAEPRSEAVPGVAGQDAGGEALRHRLGTKDGQLYVRLSSLNMSALSGRKAKLFFMPWQYHFGLYPSFWPGRNPLPLWPSRTLFRRPCPGCSTPARTWG